MTEGKSGLKAEVKLGIVAVLFALLAVFARVQLLHFRTAESDRDEVSTVWHPTLYRLVTFGHVAAAVDVELLRFMTDPRIDKVKKDVHPKVFYYLDLATDLDPKFFSLYTAGANFLSVVRNDATGAAHIIGKGEQFRKTELPQLPETFRERYWTDSWRIPFIKGYIHLFELMDKDGAISAYSQLDSIPGTPEVLKSLGESLRTPAGTFKTGERVLETMINTATDEKVKEELLMKQRSFQISKFLFERNGYFQEWINDSPARKTRASRSDWDSLFAEYQVYAGLNGSDPAGGRLFVTREGKIESTTPRVEVLGIK